MDEAKTERIKKVQRWARKTAERNSAMLRKLAEKAILLAVELERANGKT